VTIALLRARSGRSGGNPRGVALVVALIVLAAMTLAAASLMRAVDTTLAITGNLAFREASIPPANAAIEEAFAALFEKHLIADREQDLPAQAYYASRQSGEDVRGVPRVLQAPADAGGPVRIVDAGNGNTLRYVIERMCLGPGPAVPANCALLRPRATAAVSSTEPDTTAPTDPIFRVTVRVDGPQNTLSLVQATLRDASPPQRMSWRILTE
jgi:Tfp pilus assembly protein PilX